MSFHERNIVTYLVTGFIVMVVYSFHMYDQYQAGIFDGPDAGSAIGWATLKMIAGSIIVNIVVSILVAIISGIVSRETAMDAADERDKLIDLVGMKVGFIVFSTFFVGSIIWLAFGAPMAYVLIASVYAMFIASLVEGSTRMVLYRRGF
ncbi:hypothetical protein [Maritalea sp.]|uniref:hypothetical protein n=1 Tax=Maritalea sp. TaxID=2003361 RepID=UPI003EF300CD